MNDPGFLVVDVKPGIKGGVGFNMAEMRRKFEAASLEFSAEEVDDGITPH